MLLQHSHIVVRVCHKHESAKVPGSKSDLNANSVSAAYGPFRPVPIMHKYVQLQARIQGPVDLLD